MSGIFSGKGSFFGALSSRGELGRADEMDSRSVHERKARRKIRMEFNLGGAIAVVKWVLQLSGSVCFNS